MLKPLKNLLLLILRLSVVILVWALLSTYYPRLSFGMDVITATPLIASPTLEPIVIPPLRPTSTLEAERQETTPLAMAAALPATSTPLQAANLSIQPLEVSEEKTSKGTLLTITGSKDNYNYQLGPLAEGVYTVGPNQHFLVYVANNGTVYISRLGETRFQIVEDVKHSFSALNKHVDPTFELSFHDTGYVYILFIYEGRFGETVQVILPRTITHF